MNLLQLCEKCCPQVIFNKTREMLFKFNQKVHSKSKKEGIQHLEEEEFQFQPSKGISQEEKQTNLSVPSEKDNTMQQEEEDLSVKINLERERNEPEEKSRLLKEQEEELYQGISKYNFKLNLEPYDQHYPLLQGKTRSMRQLFQQATKGILTRNEKSMVSIKQIETISGFKMLISYRLPCSYTFYSQVSSDQKMNEQFCSVIGQNSILQVIHPNLTLNHLQFKKFMLLEPRYFNYLKYLNSSGSSHWQVCISTKSRPSSQQTAKECDLMSISCFEEMSTELVVNSYLQIDFKSNIRARKVVLRVCEEVANYLDKLWTFAKGNYSEVQA